MRERERERDKEREREREKEESEKRYIITKMLKRKTRNHLSNQD